VTARAARADRRLAACGLVALAGCAGGPLRTVADARETRRARAAAEEGRVAPERPRSAELAAGAAAIWSGRLGDAQRALLEVADREVGRSDAALDYWSDLLALLRCDSVRASLRPSVSLRGDWDRLRRLVQIERLRMEDASLKPAGAPPVAAPASRALAVNAPPRGVLSWPVEAERWDDEAPAETSIVDHCAAPGQGPPPPAARAMDPYRNMEAALVRELTAALPPGHPALPALLFERAVLAMDAGNASDALAALRRLPAGATADGGPFSPAERAQLALVWGAAADRAAGAGAAAAARETAIARLRGALAADLPRDTRRRLSFRLAEQLRAAGRADEAVAAVGAPPHGDDALGRYLAFRQIEAHVRAGRRAEALAEAREALRDQRRATVDGDATLAAIDDFATRLLVASPITPESLELIEALGAPAERFARTERFAQMAGSIGAHASAMEAYLWLMQNDPDESRRLHHLARASVAAARAGDRKQFGRTFAMLAGQEDEGDGAPAKGHAGGAGEAANGHAGGHAQAAAGVPGLIDSPDAERLYSTRRRTRSLSWQRAMLVVARDALPALVDNDDQANLKILVDRLQRHLDAHGRGPVDAELTTIYRAASAHLREGARGYAERVGAGKRPILLGDIAVQRQYDVPPPAVTLAAAGPGSLLWVPATGNDPSAARLRRWTAPLGVSLTVAEGQR
jgi:hypothetical protein